jgi:hypothetical protein
MLKLVFFFFKSTKFESKNPLDFEISLDHTY